MKKFIPKLTDASLLEIETDEFYVDADTILRANKLFSSASRKIPNFTIDPKTNRLPFNSTKSMEKLPYYFPKQNFDKILNDSAFRLNTLIIPCIDFQIEKGASKLIPPYFYTEDVTSQIFNINIENITNVIKYLDKMESKYDIYAFINISFNTLSNENLLRYIVSSYTSDEYISHIKGYYVMVDGLDASLASENDLIGLLQLVKGLSIKKDVYVVSTNAFGYVTLLLGASGFVSGLARAETSSIENWKLDTELQKKLRSRSSKFTYMPEVFTYLDEYELEQMDYVCSCNYCKNSLPQKLLGKKIHFFNCRQRDIKNIFQGDFLLNLQSLRERFEIGKQTAIQMLSERKTARNQGVILTPINKWLSVLNNAEEIERQEEAEMQLMHILEDIDAHDSNNN